ncbi:MAG TPA: NUDIX domain-containing protein [Candidatus Saccharimonadales bacterium]|jgi:8-oxo-dGTP pyrophosphatase MutT (NUDIX family)|nr:NUDIX domain-containing protein [Candidatus Saccharimonadales bacterium]
MVDVVPLAHKKNTARGIVIHDGRILLMERWRGTLHYFSIPGGGIEPGETPQQTVVREIAEETTVTVKVNRQVLEMRDGGFSHKIYLCEYIDGHPHMPDDAPEAAHGPENRFQPGWVSLDELPELPLTYWEPLREPLVNGLRLGFDGPVKIVSAKDSG